MQNIIDVCNREARELMGPEGGDRRLCRALIEQYNHDVLKGLELSEGSVPGQLRPHSVLVGNVYRGAPAEDCEYLLERLCTWLNSDDFSPAEEELRIPFALIKAIVAHVYLAWIHPFGDGNGRTARLIEFHILFANGIPLPAAHLLSDHYNLTRAGYYRELAKASASGGDLLPFIRYALRGFLDGIREQIGRIRDQQMRVAWENYVSDRFRDVKNSPTQKRRRDLVFALTDRGDWVDVAGIDLLTPKLAREYATAGERMVQRDLNALSKMELISRRHGKVRANQHVIEAFLPRRGGKRQKVEGGGVRLESHKGLTRFRGRRRVSAFNRGVRRAVLTKPQVAVCAVPRPSLNTRFAHALFSAEMSAYFFWSGMRRISIFAGCEGGHESTAQGCVSGIALPEKLACCRQTRRVQYC